MKYLTDRKNTIVIFITSLCAGLLTHGSRMFNTVLFKDDIRYISGCGATIGQGRWFLGILYTLDKKLLGSHIGSKGFTGLFTFLLVAAACCIIAGALEIKRPLSVSLLTACAVMFPYITGLFSYSYTSLYYLISVIVSLICAVLVYDAGNNLFSLKQNTWKSIVLSLLAAILLSFSTATYQTALSSFASLLTLLAIKDCIDGKNSDFPLFIKKCVFYLVCFGLAVLLYLFGNKIALAISGATLENHQGLQGMGQLSSSKIIRGIIKAYKQFLYPQYDRLGIYLSYQMLWVYRCIVLLLVVILAKNLISQIKSKNFTGALELFLLSLVLPLAIQLIFIMTDPDSDKVFIHSLMRSSELFTFVSLIWVADRHSWFDQLLSGPFLKKEKIVPAISALLLLYSLVYFNYHANICYMYSEITQENAISYFNRLVLRIQSLPEYKADMNVAYLGADSKDETGLVRQDLQGLYQTPTYGSTSLINSFNWEDYMSFWTGFSQPQVTESSELEAIAKMAEVENMPCYPDDGSIKIINDTIVVKFS